MTRSQLRPLCLSWWTPPRNDPQAILIGKMIPEWQRQGAAPVVVTLSASGRWNTDVPIFFVPGPGRGRGTPGGRIGRWFARVQRRRAAIRILGSAVAQHRPDVIFSFSAPHETNVLGAQLKRLTGLPFISHFSDPWCDNPYSTLRGWDRGRAIRAERNVVAASDYIVFTNDAALRMVMGKYEPTEASKALVIPHCFDAASYPAIQPDPARFVVSYIGTLDHHRNPETLLRALRALFAKAPGLAERFTLRIVGATHLGGRFSARDLQCLIQTYELSNVITCEPAVSYLESLAIMAASNCLVVIDADFSDSPFLPSKVVDYAGSRRPIVGITPPGSPTARLLETLGYTSFSHSQAVELSSFLERLILQGPAQEPNEEALRRYEVSSTTETLLELFRSAKVPGSSAHG